MSLIAPNSNSLYQSQNQFLAFSNVETGKVNAAFGQVTEGYDIVEKIANVDVVTRDENAEEGLNKPVNPPVIKSLSVETFGVDYGTPETLDVIDYQSYLLQLYGINNGYATINTENTDNTETDAENTNVQE